MFAYSLPLFLVGESWSDTTHCRAAPDEGGRKKEREREGVRGGTLSTLRVECIYYGLIVLEEVF